jgi:uncharacterized membrane protein
VTDSRSATSAYSDRNISESAKSSAKMIQQPSQERSSGRSYRIESLDVLRGLLMLLMAIDHTRDYFSNAAIDPADPIHSWPALFFTRWITHICAPGFILLAGTSVYLQRQRKSAATLTRALILRGLWLIVFEIIVVSFGWSFGFGLPILQVIWVIGVSMIVLAGLQWLPVAAVGAFGAIVIFGHDLLDPVRAENLGHWSNAWHLLHERGVLTFHAHPVAVYGYPIIPWVGVMALGYSFGSIVAKNPEARQRISLVTGIASLGLFALLRFTHGYGDPGPGFEHLGTPSHTVMSFLSVQKYPPSLHYLLATLGVVLLLFALFDKVVLAGRSDRFRAFLNVYGRVPFFFYIAHIFVIHALALVVARITNPNWRFWITPDAVFTRHFDGWGYSLPVVYFIWMSVVLALYPLCAWFSCLKDRKRSWWLAYL